MTKSSEKATSPLPSEVLFRARRDLEASMDAHKVVVNGSSALVGDLKLWRQWSDSFIGKLAAVERSLKLAPPLKPEAKPKRRTR